MGVKLFGTIPEECLFFYLNFLLLFWIILMCYIKNNFFKKILF